MKKGWDSTNMKSISCMKLLVNKINQRIVNGEASEIVMGELKKGVFICNKRVYSMEIISRVSSVE